MTRKGCLAALAAVLTLAGGAVAQQTPWSEAFGEQAAKEKQESAEEMAAAKGIFERAFAEWEIEGVLHAQQDAWNHYDLDVFMQGYWNSPELTFFSGAKEHDGWKATLDRYKATYDSPGHEMGKLDFSDLRVEMLGPEAAFVRGAWHLTMSDGKTPHGLFTLVFRKFPEGWKIIHDHTSAAE